MDHLLSDIEKTVARGLVKYAASMHMFCPKCENVLDCKTTVVMSYKDKTAVMCSTCYGHGPGNIRAGAVEVWDGRALWPAKRSTRRKA